MNHPFPNLRRLCSVVASLAAAPLALALPSLQLGPDSSEDWSWDAAGETWVLDGSGNVHAYANAPGAKGKLAWDSEGATDRYAYLVVGATPKINVDPFTIVVTNDGVQLSMVASGYGTPPIEDPLSPHGIYDTWFEIYEFQFDGPVVTIGNVQPGKTSTGAGYVESFAIALLGADPGLAGLHIDLFTISGYGRYTPPMALDSSLVKAFAPFSHDAAMVAHVVHVTETGSLITILLGALAVAVGFRRRRLG